MAVNRYDGELQMVVEEPRNANREHLLFLRWLADRGVLEHSVAGAPRGAYAGLAVERQKTGVGGGSENNASPLPRGQFMARTIAGLGKARRLGM